MMISAPEAGTPEGVQFPAVFQSLDEVPVQVDKGPII
jgi:hypothetical protein